ncbi:MAG: hypothetical protein NZO41_04145 [Candidatus Bipolaricaulota bacterium]|nr:hypothetical protein [Candidatus Bipolaricaulota bacterium]MDW8141566.1 hypothetical protein [Candidatus Bipolaricaulota bacterium]
MNRRIVRLTAVILLSVIVTVGIAAVATQPPVPKGHVRVAPTSSATICFQCHQVTPDVPPTVMSFCGTCHLNTHFEHLKGQAISRLGPKAKHPIPADWPTKDCATCHTTPHKGKVAKHPVSQAQPNSSLCLPCHQTPAQPDSGYKGTEKSGQTCEACHSIGMSPTHIKAPDGARAEFCYNCHKVGQ